MKKIFLAFVFSILFSKLFSQEWLFVTKDSISKSDYSINKRLAYKGEINGLNVLRAWVKVLIPLDVINGEKYKNIKEIQLVEILCNGNRMRIISVIDYDSKGKVINSQENENTSFTDIPPDCVGDGVLKSICKLSN